MMSYPNYGRWLEFDFDFIKNLPSDFLSYLITYEGAIDPEIKSILCCHNPVFDEERNDFVEHRQDLISKLHTTKCKISAEYDALRLNGKNSIFFDENPHMFRKLSINYCMDFLREHPEFKPIVKGVKYIVQIGEGIDDDAFEEVRVVPLEEYLELEDKGEHLNMDLWKK